MANSLKPELNEFENTQAKAKVFKENMWYMNKQLEGAYIDYMYSGDFYLAVFSFISLSHQKLMLKSNSKWYCVDWQCSFTSLDRMDPLEPAC